MPPKVSKTGPRWIGGKYNEYLVRKFRAHDAADQSTEFVPSADDDMLDEIYKHLKEATLEEYENNPFSGKGSVEPEMVHLGKFKQYYKRCGSKYRENNPVDGEAPPPEPEREDINDLTTGVATMLSVKEPVSFILPYVTGQYEITDRVSKDPLDMVHVGALVPSAYHPVREGRNMWYSLQKGGKALKLHLTSTSEAEFNETLLDNFGTIYGGDSVGEEHPARRAFRAALRSERVEGEDSIQYGFIIPLPIPCTSICEVPGLKKSSSSGTPEVRGVYFFVCITVFLASCWSHHVTYG